MRVICSLSQSHPWLCQRLRRLLLAVITERCKGCREGGCRGEESDASKVQSHAGARCQPQQQQCLHVRRWCEQSIFRFDYVMDVLDVKCALLTATVCRDPSDCFLFAISATLPHFPCHPTGMDDARTYASGASGSKGASTVLGADGRPIDDPMSRSAAAFSNLSFSDSDEEGAPSMTTAPSVMRKFTGGAGGKSSKHLDDLPTSTK